VIRAQRQLAADLERRTASAGRGRRASHAPRSAAAIQAPSYPSATSSRDSVSSLVMTTNLPSNFSAVLSFRGIEPGAGQIIRGEIAAVAARGQRHAGEFG
jgi:hypothetical protein